MSPMFLDADLYCSEDQQWEEDDYGDVLESSEGCFVKTSAESPTFELPELMLSDDEEVKQMLLKEGKTQHQVFQSIEKYQALVESRHRAVDWILKAQSFFSFSPVTAVLAVNYLDRFIFHSLQHSFQRHKPWMTQLSAVACLSLAAKVEEIHVPLLLDLQVGETKYVFEAKTIQRMEILVLSALEWKMNPESPLAFMDQFIHKLGWNSPIYGEFIQRCELVILSTLFDARSMSYPPSIMASASMLHVISHVNPSIDKKFKNQLLDILGTDKERVSECYNFIRSYNQAHLHNKRKFPWSPTGVLDATFSSDSSQGSWITASSSSPDPQSKRGKMDHGYWPQCALDEEA